MAGGEPIAIPGLNQLINHEVVLHRREKLIGKWHHQESNLHENRAYCQQPYHWSHNKKLKIA